MSIDGLEPQPESIVVTQPDKQPSDDIRPTQRVPVLLEGPARPRRLGLMRWGWARGFAASGNLINARAEDMAVQRWSCLVPATSWFEWLDHLVAPQHRRPPAAGWCGCAVYSAFLGHGSLDTTKIYLRLVPGRLKEDFDRAMPEINDQRRNAA